MLKKLRIKFVCINMTIVTCILVLMLSSIAYFESNNIRQSNRQFMMEVASKPIYMGSPSNPEVHIISDTSLIKEIVSTTEAAAIQNVIRNCFMIGIVSFFIFLALSIALANWSVKPVEKAWDQQKQFIADASHELKTPLSIILTNAELLTSQEYDSLHKETFSQNILAVAKQMRSLVEGLLELSRIDNHSIKLHMQSFDFSKTVEDSLCIFEVLFFERGLLLFTEIEKEIHLTGSESHLKQVLEILLDNALKYAAPKTQVSVRLKTQTSSVLLVVSNIGEPMSKEDLQNIFKRFYQTEKSHHRSDSYGLGLAIAEGIVLEHRGKIWAESINGVNTFFVKIPQ